MENEGAVQKLTIQTADPSQVMRQFVRAATVRAVRTMAQTAASLLGAKALISDVDWKALVSATVMAGILSILTSVYSGLPETELELAGHKTDSEKMNQEVRENE